jgi:surface protein
MNIHTPLTDRQLRTYVSYYKNSPSGFDLPQALRNNIAHWNVSQVTDMSRLFDEWYDFDIELHWDTGNVTNMAQMFRGCRSYNKPINFDTHNVNDMGLMFLGCSSFDSSINFTDTSMVQGMNAMFRGCVRFNKPVNFNTIHVTHMNYMFDGCRDFNQSVNFDTRNVRYMEYMFRDCRSLDKPVHFTDTSRVVDDTNMFLGADKYSPTYYSRNSYLKLTEGTPVNYDLSNPHIINPNAHTLRDPTTSYLMDELNMKEISSYMQKEGHHKRGGRKSKKSKRSYKKSKKSKKSKKRQIK